MEQAGAAALNGSDGAALSVSEPADELALEELHGKARKSFADCMAALYAVDLPDARDIVGRAFTDMQSAIDQKEADLREYATSKLVISRGVGS